MSRSDEAEYISVTMKNPQKYDTRLYFCGLIFISRKQSLNLPVNKITQQVKPFLFYGNRLMLCEAKA